MFRNATSPLGLKNISIDSHTVTHEAHQSILGACRKGFMTCRLEICPMWFDAEYKSSGAAADDYIPAMFSKKFADAYACKISRAVNVNHYPVTFRACHTVWCND